MTKKTEFSDEELLRYSRHILLPEIDMQGQLAIANARVLIVGAGGLGSPVALYLAAAGVGQLVIADFDEVELSNLQRQIIHFTNSLGKNKAESAAQTINLLNHHVETIPVSSALSEDNLVDLLSDVDVVVDCSDNFLTRRSVNKACWQNKKPLVSGAAIRFEGQLSVFDARHPTSPCYQCLFPELPNQELTCSESGILSPVVGVIGSMQAVETLKLIAACGVPSIGRLQLYDGLVGEWRSLKLNKDPACSICRKHQ